MAFRYTRKTIRGFSVLSLANHDVSVSVVPELGGRIVSLRDRASGREWLDGWMPAAKRRIWHPTDPADFATGPGAGIDECLPTVLPCKVGGKYLPDHGDLWNTPADFSGQPAAEGIFECRWKLRSLPLAFERRISFGKRRIVLDYRIENLAAAPPPFLWAWHPLFAWKRGDEMRFARSVKTCLTGDGSRLPWPGHEPGCDLSRASFPKGATPAAKVFIGPLADGAAEIRAANGARLSLKWPAEHFPYAGIWITRGFWKGLHHWAIEPTNAPVDCVSDIRSDQAAGLSLLAGNEVRTWQMVVGFPAP